MGSEKPEDFNLTDPAVQECPYHAYNVLRDQAPVHKDPHTGYYVITRYDDLKRVLRDYEYFSRDLSGAWDPTIKSGRKGYWRNPQEVTKVFADGGWVMADCLSAEPPVHNRFRSLADPAFTAGKVKAGQPYIEALIHELVDGFIDDGKVEFITQFCVPLPMHVIADRMGLPKEDLARLKAWSQDQVDSMSQRLSVEEEIANAQRQVEFQHYLVDWFARKRQDPQDDILSILANARDENGEYFKDTELLSIAFALNIGGNETTTNSISSGMLLLMQQPDKMAELRGNRALIKNFIEEIIRLETPVQSLFRTIRKEVELGGVTIPVGATVDMRFGAANRDPAEFPQPEEMDLHRKSPGKHMAYGTAHHYCIGAPLARQEMTLAFNILLDRLDNIQLAPEGNDFTHHPHFALRGLKALHLTFDKIR